MEILDGMDNGLLIINNDNDLLKNIEYDNLIRIGIDNESDYTARKINDDIFSSSFYINDTYISIPVGSRAFIYNALVAFAIGWELGLSSDDIKGALNNFKLSPHRLEMFRTSKLNIIDDTYNASLDSVRNSLELLGKVKNRKVFIFGDVLEADGFGEEIHMEIGNVIVDNSIDVLISVGKLSRYTYDVVKDKNVECYHFDSNSKMLDEISNILKKDDMVLVKGSHGMKLIDVVQYLKDKYK